MREAGDEPQLDGNLARAHHDDRGCVGDLLSSADAGRVGGQDSRDVQADQLGYEVREPLVSAFAKPDVDRDVLSLDVAVLGQTLSEVIDEGRGWSGRPLRQVPNPRDFRRLLPGERYLPAA